MKGYIGAIEKGLYFFLIAQANAGVNAVGLIAEGAQHVVGFFHGLGFIEDLSVYIHDGICGYEYFVGNGRGVVHGFVFGQEHANLFGWQGGRKILIGIDIDVIELKTRIAEELMSAR
jgi:hypothetical protein